MCEHCRSFCHCSSYFPRRSCSCSAAKHTRTCELCSSESCGRYCSWNCACCRRNHFRSHSICGLFHSRNPCDECELRARRLTGHYLKMRSTSTSDLYKTHSQSQSARKSGNMLYMGSRGRLSRRDSHFNEILHTPGCTANLIAALQECTQDVDCEYADDYDGIPFTYYPKSLYGDQYRTRQKHLMYNECLDELKRRLFSLKRKSLPPRKLFNEKFLNDWNKLYALVGGGMEQIPTGQTLVPQWSKISQPIPAEAMHEYRAFFGRRRRSSRRSSFRRRSSPYRKPSRRSRRSEDSDMKHHAYNRLPHYYSDRDNSGYRDNSQASHPRSDYVFKYPTHLGPHLRARLSTILNERLALFGSLIGRPSLNFSGQPLNFENYERRHTIDLGTVPSYFGGKFTKKEKVDSFVRGGR